MSVLKAVISNFQWEKKRPIERPPPPPPPTRRDTRSIGHFQHSRKTLLVSWPKRVSQEFRSKNYKESPTYAAKQKIILYRPSSSYNPGQNYLTICTPPCTLSNATTLFQQQLICGTKFPSPQVNVVSYKCLRIRVALEHTTTLLPRGGGKGGRGIARMLGKML